MRRWLWGSLALAGLVLWGGWWKAHATSMGVSSPLGPSGYSLQTTACIVSTTRDPGGCNNLAGGGTVVKGFKLIAGASPSRCALYDATAVPITDATKPVDEHYQPTADEESLQIWPLGITFTNGVSVAVTGYGSVCLIYT